MKVQGVVEAKRKDGADREGNLYVVNVFYGQVFRISPAGEVAVVAQYDGVPNGLKIHKDGRIFIADHRLGLVLLDPASGKFSELQAEALHSPPHCRRIKPASIVDNGNLQEMFRVCEDHLRAMCAGMLANIRQCLLNDTEKLHLDRRSQALRFQLRGNAQPDIHGILLAETHQVFSQNIEELLVGCHRQLGAKQVLAHIGLGRQSQV